MSSALFSPAPRSRTGTPARFQRGNDGYPITYSYKTGGTRHYQAWLRQAAQDVMGEREPFNCAVEMVMIAYMPIPKSGMRKAERILAERNSSRSRSNPNGAAHEGRRGCLQRGRLDR